MGDATLSSEVIAAALREALLTLENLSMGLVVVAVESPVPIAVTAPIRADVALPSGWTIPTSVTGDTPMLFEIIGEKPSPVPAIPQVSGRRLRLFRV